VKSQPRKVYYRVIMVATIQAEKMVNLIHNGETVREVDMSDGMDEADKALAAMGYTPVSETDPAVLVGRVRRAC
jgi:hypothetical protein